MNGVYIIPPALFGPAVLSAIAIAAAVQASFRFLVALPFVWLGSFCATPNLHLADGCLTYLAIFAGIALIPVFPPLGGAILFGSASGYCVSFIEQRVRMRPAPDA